MRYPWCPKAEQAAFGTIEDIDRQLRLWVRHLAKETIDWPVCTVMTQIEKKAVAMHAIDTLLDKRLIVAEIDGWNGNPPG